MKKNTMLLVGGIAVAGALWYRHQAAAAAPAATGLDGILDIFRTATSDGRLLGLSSSEKAARAAVRAWNKRWGNPLAAPRRAWASLYKSFPESAWPWITDELQNHGAPVPLCHRGMQDAKVGIYRIQGDVRRLPTKPIAVPRGSTRRYP